MAPPLAPYGAGYFGYAVVGIVCFNYAGVSLDGLPRQLSKEQAQGTLEPLLAAPVPAWTLFASMALWNILWASIDAAVYLLCARILFGLTFPSLHPPSVAAVWLLTVATLNSLALVDLAVVVVFKRGNLIGWVMGLFWGVVSGAYFPIHVLPDWLRQAAVLLPTTHAIQAMELAVHRGAALSSLWPHLAAMGAMGALFFLLGSAALQRALRLAKISGGLAYA
jgi:ABC-2 type transport system permease protein